MTAYFRTAAQIALLFSASPRSRAPPLTTGRNTLPPVISASNSPRVDSGLCPCGHRNRPDLAAFAREIHDAPAAVALLNVIEVEAGEFGSAQPATDQEGEQRAIARGREAAGTRRRRQELLGLLER